MNARVDPATFAAPLAAGDDAELIARCKAAIKALEREMEAAGTRFAIEDAYYPSRPPYPACVPGLDGDRSRSASSLRQMANELPPDVDPAVRRHLKQEIAAVAAWERECGRLRRSSGLAKAERRSAAAKDRSVACVTALLGMPARSAEGAGMKATVLAYWLEAGWGIEDLGEEIARSVVADMRRLVAADDEQPVARGPRRRRTLQ